MPSHDDLLAVVEAIYAAGLEAERWSSALAGMTRLVGGVAATIEVFDKQALAPRELHCHGLPPAAEIKYVEQYFALNRRLPIVKNHAVGEISWDYRMFDEDSIRHDPFYMEFLAQCGLRYFVGGMIVADREEFAGVCVHRSPKQGHIDKAGLALMERLLPHVKGAFDMSRRLRSVGDTRNALERALDWLADGVALLQADGRIVYANRAFEALARRNEGIRLNRATIELADSEAKIRLDAALAAVHRLRAGGSQDASADFPATRASGGPPYLISVRPIPVARRDLPAHSAAVAIVFVHDPLSRNAAAMRVLQEIFGLTEAEAALAQALQSGMSPGDYARERTVSLNTVYTHLRRIKDKTGAAAWPS